VRPRVSVLLTSYNKPAMLAEAIDSVLDQTYRDFELIVLDDNSAIDVRDVLFRHWGRPNLVLYKSNVGPLERPLTVRYATLANIGLQLARGEYVTYLCDDDLYLSERLERMVERLDRGDCQVVYGSQEMWLEEGKTSIRAAVDVLTVPGGMVDHSSVMHTRKAGLEVGGWDDDRQYWRAADGMFFNRLAAAGHHFHPIPEVLDVHRYHAESVSGRMQRGLEPCG